MYGFLYENTRYVSCWITVRSRRRSCQYVSSLIDSCVNSIWATIPKSSLFSVLPNSHHSYSVASRYTVLVPV
jgi:hypothetical protein